MKFKLFYLTTTGCEWLEETITYDEFDLQGYNWKYKIDKYFLRNKGTAASLVNKWNGNGEDVNMYLDCENINVSNDLYIKIVDYIDRIG